MPSLNIAFSEEEMQEIRSAAIDSSLKAFVHDRALGSARDTAALVDQLSRQIAETSAELNARLA